MTYERALTKDHGYGITRLEWRDVARRVVIVSGQQRVFKDAAEVTTPLPDSDRAASDWIPIR